MKGQLHRNANVSFKTDFTDGDVSDITDAYNWGSPFPTITESAGVLTLTGTPSDPTYAAVWFDTDAPAESIPVGSYIEVKLRFTSTATGLNACLFVDGYEGLDSCFPSTGDWQVITLTSSTTLSQIGITPWWDSGTWLATDKLEIEYIRVIEPTAWTAWSPLLNRSKNLSAHDRTYDVFQVGFDLTSSAAGLTPKLRSVSIAQ